MVVKELFAKMGLELDSASFIEAELAVAAIKKVVEKAYGGVKQMAHGFVDLFLKTTDYASSINDMSERTGLSTTALQELRYAAKLNGMQFEELAMSAQFLGTNMVNAAEGSGDVGKAFATLGVKVTDPTGKLRDVNAVMDDLAVAFGAMDKGAKKTELAKAIFGRSGAALIPMLKTGKGGLADLRKEAHTYGVVLDEDVIQAGDEFGDNLDRLTFSGEGLRNLLAGPLLAALADTASELLKWIVANKEVIKTNAAKVVTLLMFALDGVKLAAKGAVAVLGTLAKHLDTIAYILLSRMLAAIALNIIANGINIASIISTIGWYVALSIAAARAWLVATAPVVLAAAIIFMFIAVLEDLYYAFTGGESVLGDFWAAIWDTDTVWAIRAFFSEVSNWVKKTWTALGGFKGIWDTTVAWWKSVFFGFFGWVLEQIKRIPGATWLMKKMGVGESDAQAAGGNGGASGGGGSSATYGAPFSTDSLFGGGASPAATVQNSSSATRNSSLLFQPQVNAPMTFNVPPGTDPKAIAAQGPAHVDEQLQRTFREALAHTQR